MRTIKTREMVDSIKVLEKTVDLASRSKGAVIRTKEVAEGVQAQRHASPSEYAGNKVNNSAQVTSIAASRRLSNPQKKVQKNIEQAYSRFQEVKRQLPKERKLAAEQTHKTAQKTRSNADSLIKKADYARDTALDAKSAVREAKQSLRETRQVGRKTLQEVKQKARSDLRSVKFHVNADSKGTARGVVNPQGGGSQTGVLRPGYLNKGTGSIVGGGRTGNTGKPTAPGIKATGKGNIKAAKKTVKTSERAAKQTVKTARQTAKAAQKTAQTAVKAAKAAEKAASVASKAAARTAKATAKATIATVKAIIAAVRSLVALIAAGGWIAVLVILIVCLIALLVGSVFGVFFSGEANPNTGKTINSVIAEIDAEYTGQLEAIISSTAYDMLDMSGARAMWKQVLAVYTVRTVTDPSNPMEVATVNDAKSAILQAVFWDMNAINHSVDFFDVEEDVLGEDGLPTGETITVTKTILRIAVSRRTIDEMAALYGFTGEQSEWLAELLKPEYINLWNALLYGVTSIGDGSMIEIAETQLGNVGGETYWRWYGFSSREDWCACFVSWCAYQAGHVDAGIIPSFASCAVGIEWFRSRDQWYDSGYTPAPGDLIFFDWEPDGVADHVGIVEYVDGEYVCTIEGNSSDSVRRRNYQLDSVKIFGYGVPTYKTT